VPWGRRWARCLQRLHSSRAFQDARPSEPTGSVCTYAHLHTGRAAPLALTTWAALRQVLKNLGFPQQIWVHLMQSSFWSSLLSGGPPSHLQPPSPERTSLINLLMSPPAYPVPRRMPDGSIQPKGSEASRTLPGLVPHPSPPPSCGSTPRHLLAC
jgi:hypothetical protein